MFKQTYQVIAGLFGRNLKVEVPYYGVLNDKQICELATKHEFITPYQAANVKQVNGKRAGDFRIGEIIEYKGSRWQVHDQDIDTIYLNSVDVPGKHEAIDQWQVIDHKVGALSFGTSSFGYDFTLADEILLLENPAGQVINVKNFDVQQFTRKLEVLEDEWGRFVILPPHSFVLARTVEKVVMPDDVVGLCYDKSTYARIGGVQTNITVIEPGFEGTITLEIRNTLASFTRLYVGEGIIQTVFFRGQRPAVTYRDKNGKYQHQVGVTGPRI